MEFQSVTLPPSPELVTVVTDGGPWSGTVLEVCDALGVVAETTPWSHAGDDVDPGRAIVAEIPSFNAAVVATLRTWSRRAWQPMSVLSVAQRPGRGALIGTLRDLGYGRIIERRGESAAAQAVRSELRSVLESGAWLIPRAANALRCQDTALVRALEAALQMIPRHHTVTSWAALLEFHHRQALHELFAERGLPPPKDILDHLRLARVAHFAARTTPKPTRDALAARFGYSSGDYLGKSAKRRLGITLGDLLESGPCVAIARLAASTDGRRATHV